MSAPSMKAADRPEPLGGPRPQALAVVFGWLAGDPEAIESSTGALFVAATVRTQDQTTWRLLAPPGAARDELMPLLAGDFVVAKGEYESRRPGKFLLHVERIISVPQPRFDDGGAS